MPSLWAIADLHLSFGVAGKAMDPFGPQWENHPKKIEASWKELIAPEDLVLIAGDISWAMTPEQAIADLNWIDQLPGTKVMLRGNHDYWWSSLSKVQKVLPQSIHVIQNNSYETKDYIIGGARLWDSSEYNFNEWIDFKVNPLAKKVSVDLQEKAKENEKIFDRELLRLEASLKTFDKSGFNKKRLVMTHYPPIGADLCPSRASKIFEKYNIEVVVFGHLHNVKNPPPQPFFGKKNGISYMLTAADFLDFKPLKIF